MRTQTPVREASVSSKRASQRFPRFPAFGPEHDRRVAWGKQWGQVGASVRKMIEEGRV